MAHQMQGVDHTSLRGKVFAQIKEAILEGVYQPGQTLRESTIAKELGVSRTPVREAIRQLELEGLVASIPNKETVVAGISDEDVHDIFLIRAQLEGLAGKKAVKSITKEELEELEEILALTSFYVQKQDINALKQLDHRFHEVIYKATKSKTLRHILSDFHHYIQRARKISIGTPGRAEKVLEEHQRIYEALKDGDEEAVERLINEHVHNAAINMKA